MKKMIYIIDDEPDHVKAATLLLEGEGYQVKSATDPEKGLSEVALLNPDLILLDIQMPKLDGFDVCKRLKAEIKTRNIPIILVSVKSDETNVVVGLELGAIDYIRKPFFERELLARVKSVLNRDMPEFPRAVFKVGPFKVDLEKYKATSNGDPLNLTAKEFELFGFFLQNEGRVVTRQAVSQHVWGLDSPRASRTIDFHVFQLRKKLKKHSVFITALKGIGYRFEIR